MRRWTRLELHRRQGHWFWPPVVLFAIVAYVPLLLTRPGRVSGDTLDGLYVDPTRTFLDAATRWDPGVSFGAVVDRTFGAAFPMSPYYWLAHIAGVPTWMAQRVWMGTILFVAALGVVAMLRVMAWDGPAWVVAPLAYISSPYVLSQLGIQSVTLLAFAALPWLVALTVTALEGTSPNRWREPARIGVIVALTASGSISAFLGVLPGPLLWVLYVVVATREVPWRRAAALLGRTAVTSCAVSAWWLIGLLSRPRAEVAFVRQRDPARRVASASIPSETIRGLGDWRFYAHVGRSALDAGYAYQRVGIVILLTFVPLAMALLTLGRHRFHNRIYFVGLLAVGVVLSSGMSPARHPEAYGRLLQDITSTSVGSFLLPTSRCAPLTALAIAFGFAAGIRYIAETVPDRSRFVTICASALAMAMVPAFYTGHSLDGPLLLADEVPQYWRDAAADLDDPSHHGYGVLEVPGLSAPEYEWGTTRQPISSSLIRRTVALRTPDWPSQPAPANLIAAIDEAGSSEGQLEPQAIGALARLLGIDSILLRLDTPDERAAADQWQAKLDRAAGLGVLEKHEPYTDDEAPDPQKPRLIVYTVPEKARLPLVRLIDPQYGIVVAGTGPAVVSLANRGLVTGREAVQYSGTMDDSDFQKLPVTTPVIVTDSSRWTVVSDDAADPLVEPFSSPLEPARVIRSDQPTPLPDASQAVYSKTVFADGLTIGATSYNRNGVVDLVSRPANAFDGDPQTTWLTAAGVDPRDDTLTVEVTSGRQKFGGNHLVVRQAAGPGSHPEDRGDGRRGGRGVRPRRLVVRPSGPIDHPGLRTGIVHEARGDDPEGRPGGRRRAARRMPESVSPRSGSWATVCSTRRFGIIPSN